MNIRKFIILTGIGLLLSACNTSKVLKPEERLLHANKIQIEGKQSIENKLNLNQQLITLIKQKPNRNFFLVFPREYLYYRYVIKKKKSNWISNSLAKQSEKPSVLDTSLCRATQLNIYNYLYNQGYFNAKSTYKIDTSNFKVNVIYRVNPGQRYFINDVKFIADDKTIQDILINNSNASFLVPGEPLDNSLFQNEKARISDLLFNNGFAEFNPVYIQNLDADTVHLKANIILKINNPEGKSNHPRYSVNYISVNPSFTPNDSIPPINILYDSLIFQINPENNFIRPKAVASKILFRPGQLSNKSLVDETYNQLSKLGTYRFVNIEAKIDSVDRSKINYNIQLTPSKKWVFDYGSDINYTSIKTASKTLFGISGFAFLKNRNLFRGAESFTTRFEIGTELNVFKLNDFNSLNIHFSNELSFPSFYDLTGSLHIASWLARPFAQFKNKPDSRTNIVAGLDYENLVQLYQYLSFNTNVSYDWQIKRRKRISLNTIGFSLYLPKTTPYFNAILDSNIFLKNSFIGRRLFTSFLLDNLTFYYQGKIKNKFQNSFITSTNISGFEINLANQLYSLTTNKKDTFSFGNYEFSKFFKSEFDYRAYYSFTSKSKLAARFSIGFVSPFGSSNAVPYIKQFYVGGPQSLRAWNIRELGPGNLNLSDSLKNKQTYYAAGDFKLESSIEYRFDVVWRLKAALFLDAGNIWLLPKTGTQRGDGFLNANFLDQIAIGTGFGLRFDLSYFLFRVDIGFKLRNPYLNTENRHWIFSNTYPVSIGNLFENYTIHIALDYPF